MKMIRPVNSTDFSLIFDRNSWTLLQSCNVVNPGKYSTRIPLTHHQLCPKLCIVVNSWTTSTCLLKQYLIVGSRSSFQSTIQNLKIREPSRTRGWWFLDHQSKINVSMKIIPVNCIHSINLIWLSDYQLFRYVKHLFHCEILSCIFDGMQIFWVILSHEHKCLYVENINIHHIKECLLLSCLASFQNWSNIFRTRSFTLCKNDLVFNDMSDSATVLESASSSPAINLSVCCANKPSGCSLTHLTVLTSITSSDFHSWED